MSGRPCYQKDYLVQKISDLCELIDQMYITGESIESFLDELEQALLTLAECRSEESGKGIITGLRQQV